MGVRFIAPFIFFLPVAVWSATPDAWIPARWTGGPLEVERRTVSKTLPSDAAAREAIENWYDPATLNLLEGSPVNCLLVTWSAGANAALERRQQALVKTYAEGARRRNLAVLGLVYPGGDPRTIAESAADAHLDGLVLEGQFPDGFTQRLTAVNPSAVVIPIARDAASARTSQASVLAIEGVSTSARNLADMGIRGAPSSEPWIESNIWLVRSLRLSSAWRPVWISYQPDGGTELDYARSVADAAVAGGRWVAALDDKLRTGLRRNDPAALATWQRIGASLRFGEQNAAWRTFTPYGNVALILDTASAEPEIQEEYLKLVARRQVPYRLILRSELTADSLSGLRTVLATALAPPTEAERRMLRGFADTGGVVLAGPSWGNAPNDQPFAEMPLGKGRLIVYREPDPEAIARDMKELSLDEAGMMAFNVPSVLTYASASRDGKRVVVQLLNYSKAPATSITIRLNRAWKAARLFTPDAAPLDLAIRSVESKTDIAIPKLALWGGVVIE